MERATAPRDSGLDVQSAVTDPAASDSRLYVGALVLLAALLLRLLG